MGYGVNDDYSGSVFSADESRDGGATQGSYSVELPDGRTQTVTYSVPDTHTGYLAEVTYQGEAAYPEEPVYKAAPVYKPAPAPVYKAAPVYKPAPAPVYKPVTVGYKSTPAHTVYKSKISYSA